VKLVTIIAGIAIGLSCFSAAHAETVRLDGTQSKIPIGLNVEFLKDDGGILTVQDVAGPWYRDSWFKTGDRYPRFGWTESVIWARFTVLNETNRSIPFFLEHAYPLIDDLRFYSPGPNGVFHMIQTGDAFNFSARPYDSRTFVFPQECQARGSKTFFLRQKSSGFMNYPLIIWSPAAYQKQNMLEHSLVMIYFGIVLIMIFNYLCVYFLIRHLSYLYFVFFISSMLIFMMTQTGSLFQFVLPNNPGLAAVSAPFFLCLANIFGCRFVTIVLHLKKKAPLFRTLVDIQTWVFIAALIFVGAIPFFKLYQIVMPVAAFLSIVTLVVVLCAGIYLAFGRERRSYIFMPVSLVFLACFIFYFMNAFGILEGSFSGIWMFLIISALCLLALSIAMVDRINIMRKGLKRLSEKLRADINARSIELLLNEVASKVADETAEESRAGAGKNYTDSIQRLLNHQRELSILKLSTDVTIISNFDELLNKTLLKVKELCQAENAYLFITDNGRLLEYQAYTGSQNPDGYGYSKTIVDSVLESGNYCIAAPGDTEGVDDVPDTPERKVVCVPVRSEGGVAGAFYLERRSPEDFTVREAKMLMDFSDTVITVLGNALSYAKKFKSDGPVRSSVITDQTEKKIKQAAEYLNINYLSDISREGLAASLDISPNYLGKLFKIYTGRTIGEYISELRIREAANRLLENKDDNVITIAFSVGFESLSTFNRAFLKIMGCTPSGYKEQNK